MGCTDGTGEELAESEGGRVETKQDEIGGENEQSKKDVSTLGME